MPRGFDLPLISDVDVSGKKVLLRADLDVTLTDQVVTEDFRLERALPTIEYLRDQGAKTVIIGHLDRPGGGVDENLRLDPITEWFRNRGLNIEKLDNCVGEPVRARVSALKDGELLLLENLRFHSEETAGSDDFAAELAAGADLFVNDCFSTSHRDQTSITGLPRLLPSFAGLHLAQEVTALDRVVNEPRRPLVVIAGGGKVESKVTALRQLVDRVDQILIGGKLMHEENLRGLSEKVIFPLDEQDGLDIGPQTVAAFSEAISQAGTIAWAGPLGQFEVDRYGEGTRKIAEAIAGSSAYSVAGGGDTVVAINQFGLFDKFGWVSSGGSAMLEYLAEGTLIGIKALKKSKSK